jgi:hypothetical protein
MPIVYTVDCAPELSVIIPVYASDPGAVDFLRHTLHYLKPTVFRISRSWLPPTLFSLTMQSGLLVESFRYAVTPNTKTKSAGNVLFLPHGIIAVMLAVAWMIGLRSGHIHDGSLHLLAAVIITLSLGLILTETV